MQKLRLNSLNFAACVLGVLLCAAPPHASSSTNSSAGLNYKNYRFREVPWSIHVIRIDRARADFQLTTALAGGNRIGLTTLTEKLQRLPKDAGVPIAAINGDFYQTEGSRYSGDPRGLQIARGELVSDPAQRTSFWIDTNGAPRMGDVTSRFAVTWPKGDQTPFGLNEERSRGAVLYTPAIGRSTGTAGGVEFVLEAVDPKKWLPLRAGEKISGRIRQIRNGGNTRLEPNVLVLSLARLPADSGASAAKEGDVISISTETSPNLKGVQTAMGGGPELVRAGKAQPARVSKSRERHPRSAVGWNQKEIFFVEVDGRQRISDGMTLPELADFMVKLQCEEAMNLDGGGSAEIWMNGKILNSPCYGHERETANALVLVEKKAEARP
jgi:hypothetical protein